MKHYSKALLLCVALVLIANATTAATTCFYEYCDSTGTVHYVVKQFIKIIERYIAPQDTRNFDDNRFLAQQDYRVSDDNRFLAESDVRAKKIDLQGAGLTVSNSNDSFIFLGIVVILAIGLVWWFREK